MTRQIIIGRASCGCNMVALLDAPGREEDTGQIVLNYLREGLTVVRLPVTDKGVSFTPCTHQKATSPAEDTRDAIFDIVTDRSLYPEEKVDAILALPPIQAPLAGPRGPEDFEAQGGRS